MSRGHCAGRGFLVRAGAAFALAALALACAALAPMSPAVSQAGAKTATKTATKTVAVKLTSAELRFSGLKDRYYTGKALEPEVTVRYRTKKLAAGAHYALSYAGNTAIGTARVKVKAKKRAFSYKGARYRLTGSRTLTFKIVDPVGATLSKTSWYFTGSALEPAVAVTYKGKRLAKGDYAVSYSNNVQVGTARARVTGKGAYAGKIARTLKFKIRRADSSYSLNKFSGAAKSDVAAANENLAEATMPAIEKSLDSVDRIVDVSVWDGTINWTKAAKKTDLAFLRSYVTYREHTRYGDGKKMRADANYNAYATACEEQDLPYAAYGYLIFTNATDSLSKAKKDARVQAKKLWKASFSKGHAPLYLILDIEDANMSKKNATRVVQCTEAAIGKIQKLALAAGYGNGTKIGLYVGNHVYKTFGFAGKAGRKLLDEQVDFVWIPSYGKNTGKIPGKKKYFPSYSCDLWQYTSAGSVPGISTKVDLSIVNTAGPNAHDITWYLER